MTLSDGVPDRSLEDLFVGVYGYGKTGRTLVDVLSDRVERIRVFEDDSERGYDQDEILKENVNWREDPVSLQARPDLMISSPGVPGDHPVLVQARELGIPVWDEIELSYRLARKGTFWAITGTNGKSTCCELVGAILGEEYDRKKVKICGNRGSPVIENVFESGPDCHFVVEVSSFQMEGLDQFCPDGALVTNLGDDHLDYHDSLYEYHGLKFDLLKRVKSDGPAVIPEPHSDRAWIQQLKRLRSVTQRGVTDLPISLTGDGVLQFDGSAIPTVELSPSLQLFPENLLGVGALLYDEVAPDAFVKGLENFSGLEYRAGQVDTSNGRRIINDSKGTNPDAVRKLLDRLDPPLHLVLGGDGKNNSYKDLISFLHNEHSGTVSVAGPGSAANKFRELLRQRKIEFHDFNHWKDAVKSTYRRAGKGETVVLSPGGTSFDVFDNYRERGRAFDRWVEEAANEIAAP